MDSTQRPPSFQIARLFYQGGQFLEAKTALQETLGLVRDGEAAFQWLESQRLYIQCLIELEQVTEALSHYDSLLDFSQKCQNLSQVAVAEYILAFLLLNAGKKTEAEVFLRSSMTKSIQCQNHRNLAYALYMESFFLLSSLTKDLSGAWDRLEKIEILGSEQPLDDLLISVALLRCYIKTELGSDDEALHYLWQCYENAKGSNMTAVISSILAQMARIHQRQEKPALARVYAELALCGVSKEKQPRLFRQISAVCPEVPTRQRFDFEVDEGKRQILGKQAGPIYFGNQHILLEMALLLLKNPGKRYSKMDLIEIVWNQAYDPAVHDNLVYVSIKRLRALLESDENPHHILKDRQGYYFNPQSSARIHWVEESPC